MNMSFSLVLITWYWTKWEESLLVNQDMIRNKTQTASGAWSSIITINNISTLFPSLFMIDCKTLIVVQQRSMLFNALWSRRATIILATPILSFGTYQGYQIQSTMVIWRCTVKMCHWISTIPSWSSPKIDSPLTTWNLLRWFDQLVRSFSSFAQKLIKMLKIREEQTAFIW